MGIKYTIYATASCQYCHAAKRLLEQRNIPTEIKYIDSNPALLSEFRTALPDAKTVPQIFMTIDDSGLIEYIGGYDQLVSYLMQ